MKARAYLRGLMIAGAVALGCSALLYSRVSAAPAQDALTLHHNILQADNTPDKPLPAVVKVGWATKLNSMAQAARTGNHNALRFASTAVLDNGGIPREITAALNLDGRISQAEVRYQRGELPPIHEADIVRALNNLVSSFGAPAWAKTTQAEVRSLRMHLLTIYPALYANQRPSDSKGRPSAVADEMSPLEASGVALALLFQKRVNPDYQLTAEENEQKATFSPAEVRAIGAKRRGEMQVLLANGTTNHSVRDLLYLGDNFFTDMGIPPYSLRDVRFGSDLTKKEATK